jgi:hypothetical protein
VTPSAIQRLEASHSYGLLLGLIMASLIFQLSAPDARWARLVLVGLQAGILLLALWTSRSREEQMQVAVVAVLLALAVAGLLSLSDSASLAKGGLLAVGALVVLVVPVIVAQGVRSNIREAGAVTLQAAFGVLCIYLLVGMLFGLGYGIVAVTESGPLFTNGTDGHLTDHIYFSFVTLTTTGYGDLAPAGNLARAMAVLEALTGQLYLVTVVAVIVANLRPRRR